MMLNAPFLRTKALSKTFNGITVVNGVNLEVRAGEVVGLVGSNGSGKSTIIKVLSGYHAPDKGSEIYVDSRPLTFGENRRDRGMEFVHQDLALIPDGTVVENLALGTGYQTRALWRIEWPAERRRALERLSRFGIRGSLDTRARDMSAADATLLAIARAVSSLPPGPSLLVLDEPTSSLTDEEAQRVLDAVRNVAQSGAGVLFVSHRLGEVLAVAGRVTVMRDGGIVANRSTTGLTEREVVELMLGRPLERLVPEPNKTQAGSTLLEVSG